MSEFARVRTWLRENGPVPIALLDPDETVRVGDGNVVGIRLADPLSELRAHTLVEALLCGAETIELVGPVSSEVAQLLEMLRTVGLPWIWRGPGESEPQEVLEASAMPRSRRAVLNPLGNGESADFDVHLASELRLRDALMQLFADAELAPQSLESLAAFHAPGLQLVAAGCTACGVCARTCPTRALDLTLFPMGSESELATLQLATSACIGCRDCIAICPEDALSAAGNTDWESMLTAHAAKPLTTVATKRCSDCGAVIPLRSTEKRCPTCIDRSANPFSVRWPAHIPKPPGATF